MSAIERFIGTPWVHRLGRPSQRQSPPLPYFELFSTIMDQMAKGKEFRTK